MVGTGFQSPQVGRHPKAGALSDPARVARHAESLMEIEDSALDA